MNIYSPQEIDQILADALCDTSGIENPEELHAARLKREEFIASVGEKVAIVVREEWKKRKSNKVVIFAGDGICGAYSIEAAAELHAVGILAEVNLINLGGDRLTPDCRDARDRFIEEVGEEYLIETTGINMKVPEMNKSTIVVDGIFGREHIGCLKGGYDMLGQIINNSQAFIVSIDIPSGMSLDLAVGQINKHVIHADITVTLVGPTAAFFMKDNAVLVGRWIAIPVVHDREKFGTGRPIMRTIEVANIRKMIPQRNVNASKTDLGDVIIYAGSYGMMGAAVLATRAALRSGCGRVTCHTARCGYFVLQSAVPSAMYQTDGGDNDIRRIELNKNYDAVAIGPGIGRSDATVCALDDFLKAANATSRPLVLDADALSCIALRPTMLDYIPARSVLTPHIGEFDSLFGSHPSSGARLLKAIEVAHQRSIIIVLKGHYTTTVWPDGTVLFNTSGTEALATPGSGDVLTGLIAGFIAQNIRPELAAVAAVYIHGVAGQLARKSRGLFGVTAEDIADNIGLAIERIIYPQKD